MHREAFKKTKSYFGITGKQLHQHTGVSENHISEFLRGKRAVSSDVLDRLVEAMEELEPGSKQFYSDEIKGKKSKVAIGANIDPSILVEDMNNEQLSKLMFAIAAKLGSKSKDLSREQQSENEQNDQLALTY
jgi:transcriptional regulator with XRE-family HTH domain